MNAATRTEILLLGLAVAVLAWVSPWLPRSLEVGGMVALAALTLLVQSGIRDVFSLVREKRRKAAGSGPAEAPEEAHCMCLESTVGLGGVFAGVLLTALLADGPRVGFPGWGWPLGLAVVGACGVAMRDLVIEWKPRLRIRRVVNHGSILVRFR